MNQGFLSHIQVEEATLSDVMAIQAIYAVHVQHSLGTFEEATPSVKEMENRFNAIAQNGYPFLVAKHNSTVVGYAYANEYIARSAYRMTVEDSIYIAPNMCGKGIGNLLLHNLIQKCKAGNFKQMVALIGDSNNLASINLHRKYGFKQVGILNHVGYKLHQWIDVVIMQFSL